MHRPYEIMEIRKGARREDAPLQIDIVFLPTNTGRHTPTTSSPSWERRRPAGIESVFLIEVHKRALKMERPLYNETPYRWIMEIWKGRTGGRAPTDKMGGNAALTFVSAGGRRY
jgi:hypothetical protein